MFIWLQTDAEVSKHTLNSSFRVLVMVYLPLVALLSVWSSTGSAAFSHTTWPMKKPVPPRESPALPPPAYLHLPVFVDSRLPLVEMERFLPAAGTGLEPLPKKVRDVLLPLSPDPSPSAEPDAAVRIKCKMNKMHVQVQRVVLGSGDPQSTLKLGTCQATKSTQHHLYFEYDLGLCGTKRTIFNNQMVYSNTLHYDPERRQDLIRRAAPFSLPVSCYYNRYQYSYKIGYKPKLQMRQIVKQMRHRVTFTLTPRNAQWERLSPSDTYMLGKPMYFEAEAQFMSSDDRLYVQSCYVTPDKSHTSTPQFPVVINFGCMAESSESLSRFIPHKNDAVRFSVDAFVFKGLAGQQLYMHCTMSVSSSTPTTTAKSCNYDTKTGRWVELYGLDSVCSCCDSNCSSAASTVTSVISSRAWKVESEVRPTTNLKRKTGSTNTTTKSREATKRTMTSQPEVTLMGKKEEAVKVLEWPFRGGGVSWVEAEGEERRVKGSAVVEEEEEFTKPHMVFEDLFNLD